MEIEKVIKIKEKEVEKMKKYHQNLVAQDNAFVKLSVALADILVNLPEAKKRFTEAGEERKKVFGKIARKYGIAGGNYKVFFNEKKIEVYTPKEKEIKIPKGMNTLEIKK